MADDLDLPDRLARVIEQVAVPKHRAQLTAISRILVELWERARVRAETAEAERDRYRHALEAIGTRCEAFTGPSTCTDDPGRSPDGKYMVDRWCDPCIARVALDQPKKPT